MNRALQRKGKKRRITMGDLRAGGALQRTNRLSAHADRIVPRVSLKDVVLPPDTRLQVDAFVAAAKKRSTVYATWGFGKKLSIGKGLSVLFQGESGTGKTMTAEAIAMALGHNLYPVRLASLISKYVGDTEKNLSAVFAAAGESDSILFFDEADALFGKRLEGEGSHGRYINQQINTLLTELEKFDGVVILATNRPQAFDDAFERRVGYRARFEAPKREARKAIWQGLIPENAPIGEAVDLTALATYRFTGGTIKNVVLKAAFAAATNGGVITQKILSRAAEEESPLHEEARMGFGA